MTGESDEDKQSAEQQPQDGFSVQFDPSEGSAYGRRHKKGSEEEAQSLWLLTFTDVMALMLTFFVLLYSMSAPSEEKWEGMTDGLFRQFNKYKSPQWYDGAQDTIDISRLDYSDALNLNYLSSLIKDVVARNETLENVLIYPQADHVVLSLPQELLFESGAAEVSAEGKKALFVLGGTLSNIRNRIEVIGHTDPRAISMQNSRGMQSNWELSLRRAMSVAEILKTVGYERDIVMRGLSSGRFEELPEEWNRGQRMDLARRVDIIIMKDDGNEIEFPAASEN